MKGREHEYFLSESALPRVACDFSLRPDETKHYSASAFPFV